MPPHPLTKFETQKCYQNEPTIILKIPKTKSNFHVK